MMTRAEHLNASTLSVGDVEALLDAVAAVAEPVQLAYLWRPALPDVDDEMVHSECAVWLAVAWRSHIGRRLASYT
jgi:hypothetical protein